MSTQEFSQWVVDGNMERSHVHNTLTYMPGQSGFIGFDDIELSITQHATQVDITPHVDSRSEQFPESKRFIEPETPVPGGRKIIRDNSSDGLELQTPILPENTFDNPFGVDHDDDSGVMALSQIFKATQAPSSPNLPRQLPSSQRPSPILLRRGPLDLGSDAVVQHLSEPGDLLEMIEDDTLSPPHQSIVSSQTANQLKRKHGEDETSSSEHNTSDPAWIGETGIAGPKKRRISETRHKQQLDISEPISTKTSGKVSWKTARQHSSPRPDSKAIVIEDEANITEDETEHEDVPDSDHIEDQDSDDDSNKENKAVRQGPVTTSEPNIRRVPQRLQDQAIPLSSSPAVNNSALLQPLSGKHISPFRSSPARKPNALAFEVGTTDFVTIADSQSSPRIHTRLDQNAAGAQGGSSSDSRQMVPQSQAVKPASTLHITSTVAKAVSQQTASPPDSTGNEEQDCVLGRLSDTNQGELQVAQTRLVSPRSSPPVSIRKDQVTTTGPLPVNSLSRLDEHLVQEAVPVLDQPVRLSRHSQKRTIAARGTRSSSAIPETAYVNRRGIAHSASFPVPHGDPFAAAENLEFGFQGLSQFGEFEPAEHQSLAASFKSQRAGPSLQSPPRRSPRRPRTFSAIAADMSTQEQDSLELDAVFTTEDQEFRDALARMPASGSSPLDPVRKRKQRKAPVLLDQSSDTIEPMSQEVVPAQAPSPINVGFTDMTTPVPQLQSAHDLGTIQKESRPDAGNPLSLEEPAPSLEHSVPRQQYGRKANRQKLSQAKPIAAKAQPLFASTAPLAKSSDKPPVVISQYRKSRVKTVPRSTTDTRPSASTDTENSSNRPRNARPAAIQAAHLKIPSSSASSLETLVHHRVFAEFRGSPPGFFAATCTSCWKGEAELKYSIRFDDGSIDQLGQALIKRLELRVGDEVKVDRRQYKSSVFVVTGFGAVLDSTKIKQEAFPMTDIFGHTAIRVKIKSSGKKMPRDADELEIPVTEVFFTRGMRPAFRDRDYSHSTVDTKQLMTPTHSGPSSNMVSPHSRTRSTNKLNHPGSTFSEGVNKKLGSDQQIIQADGLFKDVVFIFTNNPNVKPQTSNVIEHEGGTILKGQKDLEDLFDTPEALNIDAIENNENAQSSNSHGNRQKSMSIKPEFTDIRLVILVADAVCRTTKYYQALALGIPCISSRWITDCLQSRGLKSWRPYLLAAGESETLDATVSQQLNLSHHEIDSCYVSLDTLIARRAQWLRNTSILLVGNGGEDCDKRLWAYTFFAWILGATTVATASDAKSAEKYLAQGKRHFDWICIDNEKEKSSSKGDRKAKRTAEAGLHGYAKTGNESTRLIDTRHVTESLILGSLVEAKNL